MTEEKLPQSRSDKFCQTEPANNALLYSIEQNPPWYLCIFLGMQHFLTMFSGTVPIPFVLTAALCIDPEDPARADLMSTLLFVSGFTTFMQVTFGIRLPIVQGGTVTMLIPTIAIINLSHRGCGSVQATNEIATVETNVTDQMNSFTTMSPTVSSFVWKKQLCEIQGTIIIASLFEILIGLTGVIGFLLRYVSPLSTAPAISLVGFALFEDAAYFAGTNWAIAVLTIIVTILFSEFLSNVRVPCFLRYSKAGGFGVRRLQIFKLLPVLLSVIVMWTLCTVFTLLDVFPKGNLARTDIKTNIIANSPWFRVPLPGQWGTPTIHWSGLLGMLGGVLATLLETIGNYYACAQACGVPPPPDHAINRGIFVEGVGSALGGIWGTGDGSSTYSENIGVIGVTKVASRRVVQVAAVLMVIVGTTSKFGAIFFTVPEPVVGGVFFVLFSLIVSLGLSTLQFVDLNSSRNIIVLGLPLFTALALPKWIKDNPHAVNTGSLYLDNAIVVVLSTNVFVGGILALFLDNLLPGTAEERGMNRWSQEKSSEVLHTYPYDFPLGKRLLKRYKFCRYFPISPTYIGRKRDSSKKHSPRSTPSSPDKPDVISMSEIS